MAVVSNPRDFSSSEIKLSRRFSVIMFYVLIGIVAAAVAIPAGVLTADAGIFEECYAAAEICAAR